MKAKIICILVLTLLIATAIPVVGIMNIGNTTKTETNKPQPSATKTGYLSVPAGAFIAESTTREYYNFGSYFYGKGWFYAPVYLPNEATVIKLTFYWYDYSVSDAQLLLLRYPFGGSEEKMVDIWTSGYGGNGFTEENTIDFADIDNTGYSYFLAVSLTDVGNLQYHTVLIEYTYVTGGSSGEDITENEQVQVSQDLITR